MDDDDLPIKKPKRNFVDAWLTDERYKNWIRKVSNDDGCYYCTICNQNFSCNAAHVSRHADSACHRNNLKENHDDDDDGQEKIPSKPVFKNKWLDIEDYKIWLREVPRNDSLCFCTICDKSFAARLAHIRRHAESKAHLSMCRKKGVEVNESNHSNTQDDDSLLTFDERKKAAEIQFAALIAERNIAHQTAEEILSFFQHVGQDPKVLKYMSMGRTKCRNIISNVLCPVENENFVSKLQTTKFSIFIDETTDIHNKKWMTVFVRYIDPDALDIRSHLVKMIRIDTKDNSADKLFHAFKNEMRKLQIPFANIIALSCDDASLMIEETSFKIKLEEVCKDLLTFPCPCHSVALVAHAACAKLPPYCDDFIKKIAYYINSNPKRSAVFSEFSDCFQKKQRKILKLTETCWLSHYTCVEKLLESWSTIKHFLQEMVASDKIKSGEQVFLSMMDNLEMKAYFLFLKYVLDFFNSFSLYFQSTETRIHLLQLKSVSFLSQICENFVKKEYLNGGFMNKEFMHAEIQKNVNEIFVGIECEEYLNNLMMEGLVTSVTNVRQNCLNFYLTAAEEIHKKLPITDEFLIKLQVFGPFTALFNTDRETPFQHVSFIAKIFDEDFDEEGLKKEWIAISTDFTLKEKENMSVLNFDEMWKEILQQKLPDDDNYKYPNLRKTLSAVRSLPNSNADPERSLIFADLKTKKRNKLAASCVNATSVIRSALNTRGESAARMTITKQHLSRMSSTTLYPVGEKKKKTKSKSKSKSQSPSKITTNLVQSV